MKGVLFDVDGTLVDTTYLHAVCWSEALRQNGHAVSTNAVHRAVGMATGELLGHLLGEDRDRSADDDLTTAHLTLYKQYWGRLRALPAADDLLRACADRGWRVVFASSASTQELAVLRSTLEAAGVVHTATSKDDAAAGKPAPDLLLAALDRAGLAASDCVYVGDSVWDGIAARRARLQFVGVECGGTSVAELREAGAVEVRRDPAALLADVDETLGRLLKS